MHKCESEEDLKKIEVLLKAATQILTNHEQTEAGAKKGRYCQQNCMPEIFSQFERLRSKEKVQEKSIMLNLIRKSGERFFTKFVCNRMWQFALFFRKDYTFLAY